MLASTTRAKNINRLMHHAAYTIKSYDCKFLLVIKQTMMCEVCYSVVRPSASGIELIELGGITPTSVTTAVILEGGVKS